MKRSSERKREPERADLVEDATTKRVHDQNLFVLGADDQRACLFVRTMNEDTSIHTMPIETHQMQGSTWPMPALALAIVDMQVTTVS